MRLTIKFSGKNVTDQVISIVPFVATEGRYGRRGCR